MSQSKALSFSRSPTFSLSFSVSKRVCGQKFSVPRKADFFGQLGAGVRELRNNAIAGGKQAIQAVASDKEVGVAEAKGLRGKLNKVVLAYSGGLDTSVLVPWLRVNYGCEVVCFTSDVGQGITELEGLEAKAKASGACQLVVKDLTEEFVKDYIFPYLRAGAVYGRKYLLGTSMARAVIAKIHQLLAMNCARSVMIPVLQVEVKMVVKCRIGIIRTTVSESSFV